MHLQLSPLELHDFDELVHQAAAYPPGDDLVAQPTPLCWPVKTPEEAETRLRVHFKKQRIRFKGDPTVRYMKVVDPATGTIISIARWHFYPNGFNFDSEIHWETYCPEELQVLPKDFNIPLYNYILSTRDSARMSWIPVNSPCWILTHMVTHASHRGKGAAGLLVKWGIEQAEKGGIPAYLEAGVMGTPVYKRYNFEPVGDLLDVDLKEHGLDMVFVMCKMVYYPRFRREKNSETV